MEKEPPPKTVAPPAADIRSVVDLLRLGSDKNQWIVGQLLRKGAQIILAGPPKSGKSLLAGDIALSLARPFRDKEKRFLFDPAPSAEPVNPDPTRPFAISPPEGTGGRGWRVLYLSLEMAPGEMSDRLKKQLVGHGLPGEKLGPDDNPAELQLPLRTLFGIQAPHKGEKMESDSALIQDLRLVSTETSKASGRPVPVVNEGEFKALQAILREEKPEIIIYDTLIQLHDLDENNNILMKSLMRTLRQVSVVADEPVAHIIIHHTRKEGQQWSGPLSADSLRGAGAVHAVADLLMIVRPKAAKSRYSDTTTNSSRRLEVHVSSRYSDVEDFVLEKHPERLTFVWKKREREIKNPRQKEESAAKCVEELITSKKAPFTLKEADIRGLSENASKLAAIKVGTKHIVTALQAVIDTGRLTCRPLATIGQFKKSKKFEKNLAQLIFKNPSDEPDPSGQFLPFEHWMKIDEMTPPTKVERPRIKTKQKVTRKKIKKGAQKGKK